ncbi:hypothetical protein AZE42_08791 [Rhizopogon vesiculosus]|uniref:Uncharacterized protein n=1 Tax=Rhizopogon vesiculosus TaxID=180088 RepID=A0A1J8PUD3_9AGAM|nr:hypothetical protein AZE42_08791 [Rhizopogon vesiculosus]
MPVPTVRYTLAFTLFMLIMFEYTIVWQRLKNFDRVLYDGYRSIPYQCYRESKWITIQSDELLPGDVISIGRCRFFVAESTLH